MLKPLLLLALAGLAAGDPCRTGSPPAADMACIECDSAGTECTECNYASFLHENGTCVVCSAVLPNCLECSDADTCTICASWFGPKIDGERVTCTRCADKACVDCRDDWQECVKCDQLGSLPAILVNGACQTCNETCANCTADGACESCSSGHGLVGGRCLPCKAGTECGQCDGDLTRCSSCSSFSGDALVDGRCVKCTQASCLRCSKSPDDCDYCYSSEAYLAVNKTCVPLPKGCWAAEPNGTCTACSDGYALSGGQCKPCTASRYCAQCSGDAPDKCTACNTFGQRGVSLVNGSCVPCADTRCLICKDGDPTVCEACTEGFYNTPNGTCLKATIEGCEEPADDGSCETCGMQRGLVGGKCVKCQEGRSCYRCDGNPAICTECDGSSTLENGACKLSTSTIPGCSPDMVRNGKCTACQVISYPGVSTPSFTMVDGVCRPCADPNCATCATPRNCTTCRRYCEWDEESGRCRLASSVQRPEDAPHGR